MEEKEEEEGEGGCLGDDASRRGYQFRMRIMAASILRARMSR